MEYKINYHFWNAGTKERTEKINMPSIKKVVNEPIDGFPEYQIIVKQEFILQNWLLYFCILNSYGFSTGFSVGHFCRLKILDLLVAFSIRWSCKRKYFGQMALFLNVELFSWFKFSSTLRLHRKCVPCPMSTLWILWFK